MKEFRKSVNMHYDKIFVASFWDHLSSYRNVLGHVFSMYDVLPVDYWLI